MNSGLKSDLRGDGNQSRNRILRRRELALLRNQVDIVRDVLDVDLKRQPRTLTSLAQQIEAEREVSGEMSRHAEDAAGWSDALVFGFLLVVGVACSASAC